jgi:ribosomal protein S18 acetylase RimI-like enzyme
MIEVKPLQNRHIGKVKALADANRDSLGYNPRKKFEEIVEQQRGLVATENDQVLGFVIYRHRKIDLQTTLSEICVQQDYRRQHIGTKLLNALLQDCQQRSRTFIQLKCPVDLPANGFYERLGFTLYTIEDGKKRQLKVWRLAVPSCHMD